MRRKLLSVEYLIVLLLGIHAFLLAYGAHIQSPTFNEPGHLAAGISHWEFGNFSAYRVNPPLVRMVAALAPMFGGMQADWRRFSDRSGARCEFFLGEDLVAANGENTLWYFTLARWSCIPFSLLGGYVAYRWAKELYGEKAGLLALTLWCFCPNIVAHGQLITSDTAATSLGLTACYSFGRWLREPNWSRAFLTGAALGAAELSKLTFIIFFPLWPLMWIVYRWSKRPTAKWSDCLREFGMLSVMAAVCCYIVNLAYCFEGSFTRVDDFQFVSAEFGAQGGNSKAPVGGGNRFAETWFASLPLPLPKNYVLGIDLQMRDFENYPQPSYLRGEFQKKGWWYYYVYALAIKVPLGTWLLLALATIVRFRVKIPVGWQDEFVLLIPAITTLVFVSSQTGFSEHMRYVLPILPFFFVWISQVAAVVNWHHWILASVIVAALVWSVTSSLFVYPHSLSYFNELVGGPERGHEHLIQSNIDWGQDLLHLKHWLEQHPEAEPLNLLYFGYFDPRHAGVEYTVPNELLASDGPVSLSEIPPGWYAISVNLIAGLPCSLYKGDGSKKYLRQGTLATFKQLKPVAMAGYSIYIYHVPEKASDAGSSGK